jgi:epoxyqueuosine reductase
MGEELKQNINQVLTKNLKKWVAELSHGVGLVGVASIDRFANAPEGHTPQSFLPDANAVVVIGLPIVEGLTDFDHFMEESKVVKEEDTYEDKDGVTRKWNPRRVLRNHIERRCSHEVINMELQTISMYIAIFLERAGYKSVYLPTTYGQTFSWPGNTNRDFPRVPKEFGPFSHRHAAVAAGLGELGLNNLLLTPQYGPRNRFVSIITTAPLIADPLLQKPVCLGEKCSLCIKNCGGKAFGKVYELNVGGHKNRLARIDVGLCHKGFQICFKKCITACPLGKTHGIQHKG